MKKCRSIAVIFIIIAVIFTFCGCSSLHKFNMKTARSVMEFTDDSGELVEEYLVAWPTYSGGIDGLPEWIRDWLPKAFWDAKELTDELSSCCISLEEALDNPDKARCDFEEWYPDEKAPPEVYYQAQIILNRMLITAEMKSGLPFDSGEKKNEYVRGYAAGTAVVMANEIILNGLKGFADVPQVANLLKLIPALAF